MSERWFRVYEALVDDPKMQRLPAETFRAVINLWCIASRNGGTLPPIEDIAFSLRMSEAKASACLRDLIERGLLDENEMGLTPHNWQGRQYKSDVSTDRVKAFRERRRNVNRNAEGNGVKPFHETPPETETETEDSRSLRSRETREAGKPIAAEADRKTGPELPAILRRQAADDLQAEFDREFWPGWPNKVGKPAALKAFRTARKRHELAAIIAGRDRYVRDKPPAREWLNPATFLNQERFNDQPASTESPPRNGRSGDPHEPLFRAIVEQFAAPDGVGVGPPGDDGLERDRAGGTAEDHDGALDLAASDYRRTGRP